MLHFFNPGHEYALLNQSPYYTPPSSMVKMQQELGFIASWYANEDDIILIYRNLHYEFKEFIKPISPNVRAIHFGEVEKSKDLLLNQDVAFWGVSPQAIHFFNELNSRHNLQLNIPRWNKQLVELGNRKKAIECLEFLLKENTDIQTNILPKIYTSLDSIEEVVNITPHKLLAKAPYSSSGRGLLWLPIGKLTRTERQILHGIIKKQSFVTIEKALNKKLDFAMEFEVSKTNVSFLGYSLFKTNEKGAYLSNYLGSQNNISKQIETLISFSLLEKIKSDIQKFISQYYTNTYEGYIGVDMMVYEENEQFFLHPCVEINVRNNMGILALKLSQKYLDIESQGRLYIGFSSKGETYNYHLKDMAQYPLKTKDNKILSGYLPLCPVLPENSYRAYIIIDHYQI